MGGGGSAPQLFPLVFKKEALQPTKIDDLRPRTLNINPKDLWGKGVWGAGAPPEYSGGSGGRQPPKEVRV